jgi:NADH-quinone oxidoreductase subunit L
MLIGCLALAGFPLLSGFWSKDEIVHAAFERSPLVGWMMLLTAGLTAYYTFRMFFLCFNGERRLPPQAGDHPHEMPTVMTGPLWVLAAGAVLAGYVGVGGFGTSLSGTFFFLEPRGYLHAFLHDSTIRSGEHHEGGWLMYLSAVVAIAGIWLAYARFGTAPRSDPDRAALGGLWRFWHHKYWLDEVYDHVFVRPLRALGGIFFATDNTAVDGAVWFVSAVPRGVGFGLKFLQRGLLQGYALSMVIGVVILLLAWQWAVRAAAS